MIDEDFARDPSQSAPEGADLALHLVKEMGSRRDARRARLNQAEERLVPDEQLHTEREAEAILSEAETTWDSTSMRLTFISTHGVPMPDTKPEKRETAIA